MENDKINRKMLNYGFWLLGRKESCEKEITDKFKKKEYPEDEIKVVIAYLKDNRYIDDLRFTEIYIRYGMNNKWGLNKIKQKLSYEKGISNEMIKDVIESMEIDETDSISRIIETKYRKLDLKDPKSKQKVLRSLALKGFKMSDINNCISKIIKAT